MRIGIVCYPTYGGSGVVATELGIALAEKGHKIHFITYSQPARIDLLSENLFYHEVEPSKYALFQYPPYVLALASKMVDVAKHEQIDVFHVHYAIPHATAAYLAKQILKSENIDIPFVTTLHGTDITLVGKDKLYEPVVKFSIRESDVVTAVSESLKEETKAYFGSEQTIDVIPNFIDLSRFKKENKNHFRMAICPDGEFLLVHVSNFRKVKRVNDVIHVFNKIREQVPAKLLMVGDGPERADAQELCRKLGTCDHIRFLGKLGAVTEVLSVCDLFIMPSEKESFGLAALEAMACEVPVISSDVGGIPEVNIDGETGYVCPLGDIDQMAAKAIDILKAENLPLFKKRALERAKQFDIENILPQYEALYERLVQPQEA